MRRSRTARDRAAADVPPTLLEREPALPWECVAPRQDVDERQRPDPAELARERARRDVATTPCALRVARHGDEPVDGRPRSDLRHELGGVAREPPSPPLLPGADEPSRLRVVDDRRPRVREREPSPRALGTAPDGPRTRRAASLADGRREPDERPAARSAERPAGRLADRAALGQEEVERPHGSTVRTNVSRLRVRSVPRRARGDRPGRARDQPVS